MKDKTVNIGDHPDFVSAVSAVADKGASEGSSLSSEPEVRSKVEIRLTETQIVALEAAQLAVAVALGRRSRIMGEAGMTPDKNWNVGADGVATGTPFQE